MADDTSPSFQAGSSFQSGEEQGQRSEEQSQRSEGQGQRGGRGPGNREPGGFRIRLSDNEMRAARAVQEAFRLRSTVAALGFSIRTVAQLLEDGQLSELVAQQQAQAQPLQAAQGTCGLDPDHKGDRHRSTHKAQQHGRQFFHGDFLDSG